MTATVKIFGPPGTGKTTTAMGILEAEIGNGTPAGWIGFISFTKAAVGEAKDRIGQRFGLSDDEMPWARTIHSMAFRLLGLNPERVLQRKDLIEFGQGSGWEFGAYAPDEEDLEESSAGDLELGDWALSIWNWCRNVCPGDPLSVLPAYPGDFSHPRLTGPVDRAIAAFGEEYSLYKEAKDRIDFTDFLTEVLRKSLRPPIAVLLVDEAQDLSPLQWECVRLWSQRCERLYLLGDDDQAIFTFQGGKPDLLIDFSGDEVVLDRSYRLPRTVHRIADYLIGQNLQRRAKLFRPREDDGSIDLIDRHAVKTLDFSSGSWFILCRNKQFLNRPPQRGNPYKASGFVWDLIDRAIPFRNLRGRGGTNPLEPDAKLRAAATLTRLADGHTITLGELDKALDHIPSKVGNTPIWEHGGKKRVTDLRRGNPDEVVHRIDLAALGATETFCWALDHDPLQPLNVSPSRKRALSALYDRHGSGVFNRTPNVTLGTIHSVKGGEADNVVVDLSMGGRTWQAFQSGQAEEERRVFYVGITRARQALYVVPSADGKEFPLTLNVPGLARA